MKYATIPNSVSKAGSKAITSIRLRMLVGRGSRLIRSRKKFTRIYCFCISRWISSTASVRLLTLKARKIAAM